MIKTIVITIFVFLEIPFFIKFLKAHKQFELTREVAILIIMAIIALVGYMIFKIF